MKFINALVFIVIHFLALQVFSANTPASNLSEFEGYLKDSRVNSGGMNNRNPLAKDSITYRHFYNILHTNVYDVDILKLLDGSSPLLQKALLDIFSTSKGKTIFSILQGVRQTNFRIYIHTVGHYESPAQSWSEYLDGQIAIHLFHPKGKMSSKALIVLLSHELGQIVSPNSYVSAYIEFHSLFGSMPFGQTVYQRFQYTFKLKMLFSTFMAFVIEDSVLRELGLAHNTFDFSKNGCITSLKKLNHLLEPFPIIRSDGVLSPQLQVENDSVNAFLSVLGETEKSKLFCQAMVNLKLENLAWDFPGSGPRPAGIGDP